MAIINCPECSKEISNKANSCPSCGFPLHSHKILEEGIEGNASKPAAKKQKTLLRSAFDSLAGVKSNIVCPYCKKKGFVSLRNVKRKKGIHGGKATAGILTGGISLLFSGLSRKDPVNEFKCNYCEARWNS